MIHDETVEKYDGNLQQLAEDLGDLRYDALAPSFASFFRKKWQKMAQQTVGVVALNWQLIWKQLHKN